MAKRSPEDIAEAPNALTNFSTPLHRAVVSRNYKEIEFLLTNSLYLDLNIKNGAGRTALDLAVFETEDERIIDLLLFTTSPKNSNIREMMLKIKKTLISNFEDINELDCFGKSTLHYAVLVGRPDIIECLLRSFPDINLRDKNGQTPVHYAVILGSTNLLEIFRFHHNMNPRLHEEKTIIPNLFTIKDNRERACPHLAIIHNQLEVFVYLIEKYSFIIMKRDELGNTCLHLAAANHKVCKFLLEEGNVPYYKKSSLVRILNVKNLRGQYPIDVAISLNNLNSFRVLLNLENAPQEKDRYNDFVYLAAQINISKSLRLIALSKRVELDENRANLFSEKLLKIVKYIDISHESFLLFHLAKSENFSKFFKNLIKTSNILSQETEISSVFFDLITLVNNFWQNHEEINRKKTPEIFYDLAGDSIIVLAKTTKILNTAISLQNEEFTITNPAYINSGAKSHEKIR